MLFAGDDPCTQQPNQGQGAYQLQRWYFDAAGTRQCVPFAYAGERGNQNNFLSREDCEHTCGVPLPLPGEWGWGKGTELVGLGSWGYLDEIPMAYATGGCAKSSIFKMRKRKAESSPKKGAEFGLANPCYVDVEVVF